MGPSGSGKSTLLNVLGLLDRPDVRHLPAQGEDVSALDDDALAAHRQQHIGFIFQFFHLIPRLTALENVELPLVLAGARAARAARARRRDPRVGRASRRGSTIGPTSSRAASASASRSAARSSCSRASSSPTSPPAISTRRSGGEVMQILEQLQSRRHRAADRHARPRDRQPRAPPPDAARRQDRRRPRAASGA